MYGTYSGYTATYADLVLVVPYIWEHRGGEGRRFLSVWCPFQFAVTFTSILCYLWHPFPQVGET